MTTNRPDTTVGATSGLGAATVLTTLARTLAETPGVLPTLHEIAAGSVDLVPCDWAAVAVAEHFTRTRARLADSTDEALMETVAEVAAEAGHSPGLAAFEAGDLVRCDDLAHECRFTAYATQLVARTPIRAVLSVPLRLHGATLGVLTLYSARPHSFDEASVARATLVAEHAAIAVEAARSDDRSVQLQSALEHSRTIGAAIGILVERHRILPDEAFQMLREASQHTNRKLVQVAADLLATGALPDV